MLSQVCENKKNSKIVILEPFVVKLDFKSINPSGDSGDIFTNWDSWGNNIRKRSAVSQKLAKKYGAMQNIGLQMVSIPL